MGKEMRSTATPPARSHNGVTVRIGLWWLLPFCVLAACKRQVVDATLTNGIRGSAVFNDRENEVMSLREGETAVAYWETEQSEVRIARPESVAVVHLSHEKF